MKRLLIASAMGLGLAALAGAASAQVTTGTVTINGSVAPKCSVATFGDTQNLGELSEATGLLKASLIGTTAGAPAFTSNFTLTCTGANAGVDVTATALDNTGVTTAPSGYSQTVNFTGRAALDLVANPSGSSTLTVSDDSAVGGATSDSFGAGNFLSTTANNVRVSAYAFGAGGAVLMSGSYTGQIVVTITPS